MQKKKGKKKRLIANPLQNQDELIDEPLRRGIKLLFDIY